jgi:delta8-fatty-acid desaturase
LIANFMGGMSIGWWCDNHNVHHCKSALCSA